MCSMTDLQGGEWASRSTKLAGHPLAAEALVTPLSPEATTVLVAQVLREAVRHGGMPEGADVTASVMRGEELLVSIHYRGELLASSSLPL